MLKAHYNILQNPPILRVLRKDGQHLCGICRASYKSDPLASHCLNQCWQRLKSAGQGITLINDLGQDKYLCLFCFRHYRLPGEAQSCADDCAAKGEKKLYRLNILPHLPQENRTKRSFQPTSIVMHTKAVVRKKPQPVEEKEPFLEPKHTELADVPSAAALPAAKEARPAASEAAPPEAIVVTPTKAVKDYKKRHRSEFKKEFSRNNAKYMCLVCNTDYFTKAEVEACFKGHFDEEGYYLEKPAA